MYSNQRFSETKEAFKQLYSKTLFISSNKSNQYFDENIDVELDFTTNISSHSTSALDKTLNMYPIGLLAINEPNEVNESDTLYNITNVCSQPNFSTNYLTYSFENTPFCTDDLLVKLSTPIKNDTNSHLMLDSLSKKLERLKNLIIKDNSSSEIGEIVLSKGKSLENLFEDTNELSSPKHNHSFVTDWENELEKFDALCASKRKFLQHIEETLNKMNQAKLSEQELNENLAFDFKQLLVKINKN